jgi:hypothetical protein
MPEKIVHPINAFSPGLQEIINHYSEIKGYPIEYFITAFIAASSTALGRSFTLNTGNFSSVGIVWAAIVGKPGIAKSEAQSDAFKPIKKWQFNILRQYDAECQELEEIKANNPKNKTEVPEPKSFLLSDITPEKLSVTLAANPKGCGIVYDELAGFIGRFNRYSAGADEQMFLSLFNGDSIIRTRMDSKTNAAIEKTFLTIVGTIQPGVLKAVFQGKADSGFFDRWLMCYPENVIKPYPNSISLDPVCEQRYETLIHRLLSLTYNEYEQLTCHYSKESYSIINTYQRSLIDIQNKTDNDNERSVLAKMEVYLHRFALLLNSIEYAFNPSTDWVENPSWQTISEQAATGATVLCRYFIDQAMKIRILNPVEMLKDAWVDIYKQLPEHGQQFKRNEFVKKCADFAIKERSADEFLKKNAAREETSLFFKVGQGIYTKNLF